MITFYRFVDPASEPYWQQLEDWFATLDKKRDNGACSYGPRSSRALFYNSNCGIDPSDSDCILGTYFAVENSSDVVVATGTLVDNRGFHVSVPGKIRWSLVLTHHNHRRMGYGAAMCAHLDGLTQLLVDYTENQEETAALFAAYEPAVKIFRRLGFVHVGPVVINDTGLNGGSEPIVKQLYSKTYTPTEL